MTGPDHEQPRDESSAGATTETVGHRWHPLRWLGLAVLVVVLAILVLVGSTIALLRSETGTAWIIDRIPGLQTEQASGSLLGAWQARRLQWQGYGVSVDVQDPRVAWSPGCLFQKSLCLDQLAAGAVDVQVQSAGNDVPAPASVITLPGINLPLAVGLANGEFGPLTVNGARIWDQFTLAARGSGADMIVERADYQLGDVLVDASGRVTLRRDWPLDLDATVQLSPPSGDHWQIVANLSGSVRDLSLSGRSNGYLNARFSGKAQPLVPALPVELDLQTPRFLADPSLPDTLALTKTRIAVRGSLADGFNTSLEGLLPGTSGDIPLSAAGHLTEGGMSEFELVLTRPPADAAIPEGRLSVTGKASWFDGISADAKVQLQDFPWHSLIPGLSEPAVSLRQLTADARYEEGAFNGKVEGALEGPYGPAEFSASARGDHESVQVDNLLITAGDNRIAGSGRYGNGIQADLQVRLPRPQRLLPGLEGELLADISLGGTLARPSGRVSANAMDLAWQDQVSLADARLQAEFSGAGVLSSTLSVQALQAGGQTFQAIEAAVDGTRDNHRLGLEATHANGALSLALSGNLPADGTELWQGVLEQGELELPEPGQTWTLQEATALTVDPQGQVDLAAHCWNWQNSSICARDQRLWPDTRLALRVEQFPASALEALFPETFRWDARIDADVDLAITDGGPEGDVSFDAGAGQFELLVLDEWQPLAHRQLQLSMALGKQTADVSMLLDGPKLGAFRANLAVRPMADNQPVEGSFSLDGLDLSLIQPISGLEEVSGRVSGSGRLAGPLMNPQVFGEVALTGGRFFDPSLPLPMEDVVLALEFGGRSADISGRWQSNDRSQGQLGGRLDWQGEPALSLNVTGERLPLTYEPYARLEIEPDLDIVFSAGELSITGEVAVPRGDIRVQALPESAVRVSEDEMVVGVQRPEPAVRSMPMDVTLVVGQDRVTFDAFGLTGNLKGTLRIGNNMDTRGALQLVNGQYQKFGQDLELRRARVQFLGPLTEPYLDIEAIRTVEAVVAGIRLTGPVSAPETEIFSEPPMPQTDALSYLVLGRAPGAGQGGDGQLATAALSLGLTQASKITQGLGSELGIRELTLETEGSGEQASVVASGYITDELSLRYGVGIFEPITTVALRYDLGRYFYLEAASGLAASLDIFYTRDF
ncbi:MAG: translocation/assembly module TamB domain-containing protein [Alteromonadaceae bacterium]|nr:translocation/assembly module TamB domain-containing protein [Alteromonadaceae bacterium]